MFPKIKKIVKKPKILLLTDDMLHSTGVGTMAREIVFGTCDTFDWVQLAAAVNHPDAGKVLDISEYVSKETNKTDISVIQYKQDGYFNVDRFYQVLELERPSCIFLFTDPHRYVEFFKHEHTIRSIYKIPIIYYSVWDNFPVPYWNSPYYNSCDLLLAINYQTQHFHRLIAPDVPSYYVPHGINPSVFYDVSNDVDFIKFKEQFEHDHGKKFIVFWNNRNIKRKQPGDIIIAFKKFSDAVGKDNVCLFMKTHILDPNGTDLLSVKESIANDCDILFNQEHISQKILNYFYNLADVTISLSSAEGFGLSTAESLMAGTPIIAPVTGGLRDQMGMVNDFDNISNRQLSEHGDWCIPLKPAAKLLQGSMATPYIFDDVTDHTQMTDALISLYNRWKSGENLKSNGGREFMLTNGLNSDKMCSTITQHIKDLLTTWKPKPSYSIGKIVKKTTKEQYGI